MLNSEAANAFVRHWGELGARWGVNRSIAQIHALLYLADRPLNADEIMEAIGIARSHISNSLKELLSYDLIERIHVPADRRDHFRARLDPWDMLLSIVEERKRREIDPARIAVRNCLDAAAKERGTALTVKARLAALADLLDQLDNLYESIRRLPRPTLKRIVKMGDRIAKVI